MALRRKATGDLISAALCLECQQKTQTSEGTQIAQRLLLAPVVPAGFEETHELCRSCSDLRAKGDGHARRCALAQAGVDLHCGGWATPFSEYLRSDLRARTPKWTNVAASILGNSIAPLARHKKTVLVPIPVSTKARRTDGLLDAVLELSRRTGIPVLRAILRDRRASTRRSVAQIRRRIVEEEYRLDPTIVPNLRGARVVLIDDTVTTGATIAGIAKLLRAHDVAEIIPVSIDRTITPRLRQRLPGGFSRCPHNDSIPAATSLAAVER